MKRYEQKEGENQKNVLIIKILLFLPILYEHFKSVLDITKQCNQCNQ